MSEFLHNYKPHRRSTVATIEQLILYFNNNSNRRSDEDNDWTTKKNFFLNQLTNKKHILKEKQELDDGDWLSV